MELAEHTWKNRASPDRPRENPGKFQHLYIAEKPWKIQHFEVAPAEQPWEL